MLIMAAFILCMLPMKGLVRCQYPGGENKVVVSGYGISNIIAISALFARPLLFRKVYHIHFVP
jgi:hypothetical protein